jgi:hypothetical protein
VTSDAKGIADPAEERIESNVMAQNLSMIGLEADEVRWMRVLVSLLRHPDPDVPELARQALLYVLDTCAGTAASPGKSASAAGA